MDCASLECQLELFFHGNASVDFVHVKRWSAQERVARPYFGQLTAAHVYSGPIASRIEVNRVFYSAEAYHQDFMARNPSYPYIVINDRPKVEALRRLFPTNWR